MAWVLSGVGGAVIFFQYRDHVRAVQEWHYLSNEFIMLLRYFTEEHGVDNVEEGKLLHKSEKYDIRGAL